MLEDTLHDLGQSRVFSKVDLKSGYWHVSLDKESSMLTTFQTCFGRYRWFRLPFGLKEAPVLGGGSLYRMVRLLYAKGTARRPPMPRGGRPLCCGGPLCFMPRELQEAPYAERRPSVPGGPLC